MVTAVQQERESFWSWEVFLLGGFSIIVCMALWACTDKSASVFTMSQLAFGLAFAFNHPHFLASYMLLYGDFREKIFEQPRYFWAAVLVPFALGSTMAYAFFTGRVDIIGYGLNLMFFLVGWHYIKQVFGCVIVTSARRRIFYSLWERRIILTNLFALWSMSFMQGQTGGPSFSFYGITYLSLGLPHFLLHVAYAAVMATAVVMVGMHLRKFINEGTKPSPPGMAAMAALYVWYIPSFAHPAYAYLIPLFHSMQYLAFVWSFKQNQVADQSRTHEPRDRRAFWVRDFLGYGLTALLLGALAFEFVPKFLDAQNFLKNPALGSSPFVAFFLMFINIHHYFIDNVIWRSSNEEIKKYLFAPPAQPDAKAVTRTKAA